MIVLIFEFYNNSFIMKKNVFIFLVLMMQGCSMEKNLITKENGSNELRNQQSENRIAAEIGENSVVSAPLTITSVSVSGNIMTIGISYNGGCKDHVFRVVGSSVLAKSLPPIRTFQIIHNSNEDKCEKIMTENLKVDISALAYKQEKGSEIYLTLNGWDEKIKYVFD